MTPERQDGAVERAEPMLRANCSSVLRSNRDGATSEGAFLTNIQRSSRRHSAQRRGLKRAAHVNTGWRCPCE